MKCTHCGEEIADGARFCPNCGVKMQQDISNAIVGKETFSFAVHIKNDINKDDAYVLWCNDTDIILIPISETEYDLVLSFAVADRNADDLKDIQAEEFRKYASNYAKKTKEAVMKEYPEAIAYMYEEIFELEMITTYDSDFKQFDPYTRILLKTIDEEYRAYFEKETELDKFIDRMSFKLGDKFIKKNMDEFPF